MSIYRVPKAALTLSAIAVSALLTGCSASVHAEKTSDEPKISSGKLADTVAERLAAQTGQPKPDVSCPEDLVGKVGTKTRCVLTASDKSTVGITVTVTSVKDSQISFGIKADDKASPAPQ
ncbi:DUF4333 domain-containing protein [Streptomyces sp. NPDC090023]|uniref:DUF4333 domain-containing protein n=1 Tax=unclassified Streptomyces TaxID=2593676 RepID=UPI0038170C71